MQTLAPTAATTPSPVAPPIGALPVHPRRAGWRAGAAASLVASAVSGLQAGRSPSGDVQALVQLGGGDLPRGVAAAEELDRRLAVAAGHLRTAQQPVTPSDADALGELLDDAVHTLVARLTPAAVDGFPHPGEWVASSVDVVPCAVHGYEDGTSDCLGRSARAHLAALSTGPGLAAQVRATTAAPQDDGLDGDPVVRLLWTGLAAVAALAAWQTRAAVR